jgi:hypothetical protein
MPSEIYENRKKMQAIYAKKGYSRLNLEVLPNSVSMAGIIITNEHFHQKKH